MPDELLTKLNEKGFNNAKTMYDALYELGQHRIALDLENAKTDENGLYEEEAQIRNHLGALIHSETLIT